MNRTGLIVLAAAVVALGAVAYWFMAPRGTHLDVAAPTSEPLTATDSATPPPLDRQAAEAPPADAVAPAPAQEPAPAEQPRPDASTAPDQLGGALSNDERRERARAAKEDKDSEADDKAGRFGYTQDAPAAAPPPPPPAPPPPVASAPPTTAAKPAARGMAGLAPPPNDMPAFPWPAPKATATLDVPRQLIIGNTNAPTFGSVAERIASALDHAGYGERSYYALADGHGIAIATQLEQINDDGTPVVGVARFERASASPSTEQFSLTSYVKALFSTKGRRFRIIVFTLSGGVAQDGKAPSEDIAASWPANGEAHLPQHYALIPFTNQVKCTALVYEFEKKDFADASFVPSGKLNAMSHLTNAGIWTSLGRP